MRPILPADLDAAVRALLGLGAADQAARIDRLIAAADLAHRLSRRTGRPHPRWGAGTLEAAARAMPLAPLPAFCNGDYCQALAAVLDGLDRHRRRHQPG
jgi:hypothetical protein